MKPCKACADAKAKQKNLPTHGEHVPSKNSNERIFIDQATVKAPKALKVTVTKPNWRILVDERTQLKMSDFYETKDGMIEPTCEKFHKWRENRMPVKYLRMDGAGENMKLQQRAESADWKLNLSYEVTARNTPQQNHLAEIGFTVLGNWGHALMSHANVPVKIRYMVFREIFITATYLDGL